MTLFTNNPFTNDDPLLEKIKKIAEESAQRKQIVDAVNKDFGIIDQKQLPHERIEDYKKALETKTLNEDEDVANKHQTAIAKKTLKMPDAIANVMGGPTKKQAAEFLSDKKRKEMGDKYTKKARKNYLKYDGHFEEVVPEETELDEGVTRKHFQQVADVIKAHPDAEKRKELAKHHAEIFKTQNPRFDHKRFYAAANADIVHNEETELDEDSKHHPASDYEDKLVGHSWMVRTQAQTDTGWVNKNLRVHNAKSEDHARAKASAHLVKSGHKKHEIKSVEKIKHPVKEENLDELSKKTLKSYVHNAVLDYGDRRAALAGEPDFKGEKLIKMAKRRTSIDKAVNKIDKKKTNEESQIDEISPGEMQNSRLITHLVGRGKVNKQRSPILSYFLGKPGIKKGLKKSKLRKEETQEEGFKPRQHVTKGKAKKNSKQMLLRIKRKVAAIKKKKASSMSSDMLGYISSLPTKK